MLRRDRYTVHTFEAVLEDELRPRQSLILEEACDSNDYGQGAEYNHRSSGYYFRAHLSLQYEIVDFAQSWQFCGVPAVLRSRPMTPTARD